MTKVKDREYPIPFHNDVFFKYMLIGEDAGSAMLRSRIIEEIYKLMVQRTRVLIRSCCRKPFSASGRS